MRESIRTAAAGLVLLCAATHASGKSPSPWKGPMPGGFPERITEKHLEAYTRLLVLDEIQRRYMHDLHEAYAAAFDEGEMEFRVVNAVHMVGLSPDSVSDGKLCKAAEASFRETGHEAERVFFIDLRDALTSQQVDRWDAMERLRRRECTSELARHTGIPRTEWMDPLAIIRGTAPELFEEEPAASLLARFEQQDDRRRCEAIGVLNELIAAERMVYKPRTPEEAAEETEAIAEAVKLWDSLEKKLIDLSWAREEALLGFLERLSRVAGENKGVHARRAALREVFPGSRLYKMTETEQELADALALETLTGEQREALETLEREHYRRTAPLDDERFAMAVAKEAQHTFCLDGAECEATIEMKEVSAGVMQGNVTTPDPEAPTKCPMEKLRRKDAVIQAQTARRIREILTGSQLAQLPDHKLVELREGVQALRGQVDEYKGQIRWAESRGMKPGLLEQWREQCEEYLAKAETALEAHLAGADENETSTPGSTLP